MRPKHTKDDTRKECIDILNCDLGPGDQISAARLGRGQGHDCGGGLGCVCLRDCGDCDGITGHGQCCRRSVESSGGDGSGCSSAAGDAVDLPGECIVEGADRIPGELLCAADVEGRGHGREADADRSGDDEGDGCGDEGKGVPNAVGFGQNRDSPLHGAGGNFIVGIDGWYSGGGVGAGGRIRRCSGDRSDGDGWDLAPLNYPDGKGRGVRDGGGECLGAVRRNRCWLGGDGDRDVLIAIVGTASEAASEAEGGGDDEYGEEVRAELHGSLSAL
jgi:hypothetical protein